MVTFSGVVVVHVMVTFSGVVVVHVMVTFTSGGVVVHVMVTFIWCCCSTCNGDVYLVVL